MLVISPAFDYPEESIWVNKLLDRGIDYFHVRKPAYSVQGLEKYIMKIDSAFHDRLVVHHYHPQLKTYVSKFHLPVNKDRKLNRFSTSTHQMTEFNALPSEYEYAFLSPIFPSFSKQGYGQNNNLFSSLKERENYAVKLIGLGGIGVSNISSIRDQVDGVALLGEIWLSDNPLKSLKKCL